MDTMHIANTNISFIINNETMIDSFTIKLAKDKKLNYNEAKEVVIRNTVNSFLKNDLKINKEKQAEINIKSMNECKI